MEIILTGCSNLVYLSKGRIHNLCVPSNYFESFFVAYDSEDIYHFLLTWTNFIKDNNLLGKMRDSAFTKVTEKSLKEFFDVKII